MTQTGQSPDAHRAGILAYAEQAAHIREESEGAAVRSIASFAANAKRAVAEQVERHQRGVVAFASTAHPLVPEDARTRSEALTNGLPRDPLLASWAPSLVNIAQLPFRSETRHSLTFAWLLDPTRSGPLALPFWTGLRGVLTRRLEQTAEPNDARRDALRAALANWPRALDGPIRVDPVVHRLEWQKVDVFARLYDGAQYRFGLAIENKVRWDTGEQPRQLDRYHRRVTRAFDRLAERTVFVFLTESGRLPRTAVRSAGLWHRLAWGDVADLLEALGGDERIAAPSRLLAWQYADEVRREILGELPRQDRERVVHALLGRPGLRAASPAWRQEHAAVCAAFAAFHARRK